MAKLLSTKEVARFLGVNEKMIYSLVSDKGLPATKITGKWLFPQHLVEQWIETHTINFPEMKTALSPEQGLLILAGSNDLLLDKAIALFNTQNSGQIAVFGNLGSMGGLNALRRNLCHIATSHLLQEDQDEYNFDHALKVLEMMPAVVNFCRREQGLLVQKGNPRKIGAVTDLGKKGITIVNRSLGTGTRLLLDHELKKAGIKGEKINGYLREVQRHLDVGLEVLSGRADAGPGIRAVADALGIGFISLRWERYDLMIAKDRFFDEGIQRFLGLLHDKAFRQIADATAGYDLQFSGRMVFQGNTDSEEKKKQ
ncbi:MAG: DNA-binding protein [Deltaproteobacteria bacterium SG8_13]|nr:MAG: DNA-binding protein [Deltaproteobacteria bacterium SG8_13]